MHCSLFKNVQKIVLPNKGHLRTGTVLLLVGHDPAPFSRGVETFMAITSWPSLLPLCYITPRQVWRDACKSVLQAGAPGGYRPEFGGGGGGFGRGGGGRDQ